MTDKYSMKGNKMLWHMDRVQQWKRGEMIAPLHIDAGISRGCNINCHYCFGKTQGNLFKNGMDDYIDRESLVNFVKDSGEIGVRSIAIIGEAEPLVNPHVYEAIVEGKEAGVDMALATNGIMFEETPQSLEALRALTWIRFNISAGTEYGYRHIHGSTEFELAKSKFKYVVDQKRKHNLNLTIGLQMVLTPRCIDEVLPLAELGKELGVDYLVVKQCSDVKENTLGVYNQLHVYNEEHYNNTLKKAETMSTENYSVIVKWPQIQNEGKRCYDNCLGAPFLLHTAGDGRVFSCAGFFEEKDQQHLLGNFTKDRFRDIVFSEHYWKVMKEVQTQIDVHSQCYSNCRTNSINEFLWNFEHPPEHSNFV